MSGTGSGKRSGKGVTGPGALLRLGAIATLLLSGGTAAQTTNTTGLVRRGDGNETALPTESSLIPSASAEETFAPVLELDQDSFEFYKKLGLGKLKSMDVAVVEEDAEDGNRRLRTEEKKKKPKKPVNNGVNVGYVKAYVCPSIPEAYIDNYTRELTKKAQVAFLAACKKSGKPTTIKGPDGKLHNIQQLVFWDNDPAVIKSGGRAQIWTTSVAWDVNGVNRANKPVNVYNDIPMSPTGRLRA